MRTLTKFEIMEVSGAYRENDDEDTGEEEEEYDFPEINDDGEEIEAMEREMEEEFAQEDYETEVEYDDGTFHIRFN